MKHRLSHLLRRLVPTETRLAWERKQIDDAYAVQIAAAREQKDHEKVDSLRRDHFFELDLHSEDEDSYFTQKLLAQARRLRVPIPHRTSGKDAENEFWYEGHNTGRWYLTNKGIASLREEIRKELKARHEARTHWMFWLTGLTGVIGALTGLVALWSRKP